LRRCLIQKRQRRSSLARVSGWLAYRRLLVSLWRALLCTSQTLDSALTFNQHVSNVVRACTYHTRALRHIRPLLTVDIAKSIATSTVGARLDYCNSLLYGTSEGNLDRVQRVQNQLARVVANYRHHGLLVLRTCAVNFIGCQ